LTAATIVTSFFRRRPAATRLAHPVNWATNQRCCQLHAPATNRLFVYPSDFEQNTVSPITYPLGFHCQKPAPLLLIQPTQQQIHLPVVFAAGVSFTQPARAAPAFVNRLSWHAASP